MSVAVGIGCRSGTPGETVARLVRDALGCLSAKPDEIRLYTVARKVREPGLHEAASTLGCDLVFLPDAVLTAAAPRVVTHSARVQDAFGVGSVAEAAALVGGGPHAVIIVPRRAGDGATCAIAAAPANPEDAA